MTTLVGQLEPFLLGGADLPDPLVLTRSKLDAYTYTRLASNHPMRPMLRGAYLKAAARHMAIRARVLTLVHAWRAAGIDVLPFKGFYLAEFVYPSPVQRYYGDVDVLIRREHLRAAREVAKATGCTESWVRTESLYPHSHEEVRLDTADKILIEVHRYILDNATPFDSLQRRFTEAAWEAATEQAWEGTSIKVLQPVDSLLMGLVLARSWSGGDNWRLKPHDLLDLEAVIDRFELSSEALEARARELGCSRTLTLFLQRCNPWERRLDLRPPSFRQRQRWNLAVVPERGHLGLERLLVKTARSPGFAIDAVRCLPDVLRVRRLLASGYDMSQVLRVLDVHPCGRETRSLRDAEHTARGVKWGTSLLWPLGRDQCIPRSLALFAALRKRGYPAVVWWGERQQQDGRQAHAWVELKDRRLEDLLDLQNCEVDQIAYHYPTEDATSPAGRAFTPEGAPRQDARQPLLAFLRLDPKDRRFLFEASLAITAIKLGLTLLPLERTRAMVTRLRKNADGLRLSEPNMPDRVARAVMRASRFVPGHASCLVKALAAQLLLERKGVSTELRIGFVKREGTVEGHAWLEYQGRVVIGDNGELGSFTPLASLERQP